MSPELQAVIEAAREHVWTEDEWREYVISLVLTNLLMSGRNVTREQIAAAYDELHPEEKEPGR